MGDPTLPQSELDEAAIADLRAALLLGDDDITALRDAATIIDSRIDELLDVWYGFVGGHPWIGRPGHSTKQPSVW